MPVDYEEEFKQIESSGGEALPWFNPSVGSHRITFLSEGEEYSTTYRGQEIPKVRFVVEVNGEKYNWGINKGRTLRSLWGQIAMLGREWKGLKGKTISLVVKTTTRRDGSTIREFTVLEAVDLMAKRQQENQEGQSLKDKIAQLRGQVLTKEEWMQKLGIDENKFNSLLEIGLLEIRGNKFAAV